MAVRTGRMLVTALLTGIASCAAASAQDAAPVESKNAAYREVRTACAKDTARYCPAAAQATAIPRDQMACLKTYRVDLSLDCRKALTKARAATAAEP